MGNRSVSTTSEEGGSSSVLRPDGDEEEDGNATDVTQPRVCISLFNMGSSTLWNDSRIRSSRFASSRGDRFDRYWVIIFLGASAVLLLSLLLLFLL